MVRVSHHSVSGPTINGPDPDVSQLSQRSNSHPPLPYIHFSGTDAMRFAQGHTAWSPALNGCGISRTDEFRWSIMINFISDSVLLLIMVLGVMQKRNATYLWNMLYFQALFWILAATMTELPAVVCPTHECSVMFHRATHGTYFPRRCLLRILTASLFSILNAL
jgi:hypothetical protein